MAHVLLVDDEANILTVLSMLFRIRGDRVATANGGERACELLRQEAFDLMVSDLRMKPINGMEVLRFARECRPEMPVIMVTAYDTVEAAQQALALGAFAYIKKPFDNRQLLELADEAMRRQPGSKTASTP